MVASAISGLTWLWSLLYFVLTQHLVVLHMLAWVDSFHPVSLSLAGTSHLPMTPVPGFGPTKFQDHFEKLTHYNCRDISSKEIYLCYEWV